MKKTITLAMSLSLGMLSVGAHAAEDNPCLTQLPSQEVNQLFSQFASTGKMPPQLGKWLGDEKAQAVEPMQVFDNVDYVGICWVSSWLIKSDQGLILIDSLYQPFTDDLLSKIKALGYDYSDVKYVLITHGHFDHAGGIGRLQQMLPNARIGMTEAGWKEAYHDSQDKNKGWDMPEKPDLVIKDQQVITLGNTSVTAYTTPGHTWGTTSYAFDVFEHGEKRRAVVLGGLGLNAISGPEQVEQYIQSIDKIKEIVLSEKDPISVDLTGHPFSSSLMETFEEMKKAPQDASNPLVNQAALIEKLDGLKKGAQERLAVELKKQEK